MREERSVKRVYPVTVKCNRRRRKPQKRWRDEVLELLMEKGFREREERVLARDREV